MKCVVELILLREGPALLACADLGKCVPASYARLLCGQVSLRSPVGVLPVFEELVLPLPPLPGALQSGRPGPSEAVPRVARRPMCVVSAGCTPVAGGVAVRWSAVAPGPGVAPEGALAWPVTRAALHGAPTSYFFSGAGFPPGCASRATFYVDPRLSRSLGWGSPASGVAL